MRSSIRLCVAVGVCALATTIHAATALRFGGELDASRTATPTEKAKLVRLAYLHDGTFRKAWLFTYGDGPTGRQNVYARYTFDEGATWSPPILLSRDASQAPTGGQAVTVRDALSFVADNEKPTIFAPPVTTGPAVVVTWNSAYCPSNPAATDNAGGYVNSLQGAGDFNGDGTPDLPFHCIWVATTTDPTLATWDVQQITTGERYAMNEVLAGSSAGNAYALAWQEDPAGLQPGEAEGRGDGGMGSHASGGTNIWYTHASAPSGATLRANVARLSDNNVAGTGEPGASRPSLQLSGSTAVVAYEETACPGGNGGKCIVYHAFNYAAHDANYSGNIVSDVTRHARRARLFLQGAAAAGTSGLRTVLLWRESPVATTAAPADIVVRRGLVDTLARPGSTGFLPADILAEAPQYMTNVAASGGNANAHRAIVRGSFVGLAYDLTPSMDGANPEKTPTPTANYNLFLTRSTRSGEPGSWSAPANLSRIDSPALTVVEPRLVPTPGTVVNPLTGTPDPGDAQDTQVLYASFATEANTLAGEAGRVYVARSTDQGASFEPFVPVSAAPAGQSEAQLRPSPDGSTAMVLWMGEQTIGDPASKDAVFAAASAVQLADLELTATAEPFPAGGGRTVTITLLNHGAGVARDVVVAGALGDGLGPVGISEPPSCSIGGANFRCTIAEVQPGQRRAISMTVNSATVGEHAVTASATSDYLDADPADNAVALAVSVTAPAPPPEEPPVVPVPPTAAAAGGGCTAAPAGAPFDPLLLLLTALGIAAQAIRRVGMRCTMRER
jgi:Domain of unknown function DUF11